jgi:hypothetical protein
MGALAADDQALREIDEAIRTFYAAFDNRGGRTPAVAALREVFLEHGQVTRVSAEGAETWDLEAFIAPREAMLTDGTLVDFHEWEVEAETVVLGAIANRMSRYRKAGVLNAAAYGGEGRKLIQLCRVAGRWRIAAVLWQDL